MRIGSFCEQAAPLSPNFKPPGHGDKLFRGEAALSTLRGRSLSFPAKLKWKTEAEEIASRSGLLWEGISRRKNLTGGYTYRFKLRYECDDITPHADLEKRKTEAKLRYRRSDPAFEPMGSFFTGDMRAKFEALEGLGYRCQVSDQGIFIELPDQEAIEANWEEIRQGRSELTKLSLISLEQEFGDLHFIDAFFTHHGFLSRGRYFIHDHVFHLMNTLIFHLVGTAKDLAEHNYEKKIIAKFYRRIMIASADESIKIYFDELVKMLSSLADDHTAGRKRSLPVQANLIDDWMEGFLGKYKSLQKQQHIPFIHLWRKMIAIETQFDSNRR